MNEHKKGSNKGKFDVNWKLNKSLFTFYRIVSFKVKFLGQLHDIIIDWNDERYSFKPQQVFKQLESITGVRSKYNLIIVRHVTQVQGEWNPADVIKNNEM